MSFLFQYYISQNFRAGLQSHNRGGCLIWLTNLILQLSEHLHSTEGSSYIAHVEKPPQTPIVLVSEVPSMAPNSDLQLFHSKNNSKKNNFV